jgi:hypothetical protein
MAYDDVIARNIAAAIARRGLSQEDVAERMRNLGYSAWIRQTVSSITRGKRRLVTSELLGLSIALEVWIMSLLLPSVDDPPLVTLPAGQPVHMPRQTFAPPVPEGGQVLWDGNTPKFGFIPGTDEER